VQIKITKIVLNFTTQIKPFLSSNPIACHNLRVGVRWHLVIRWRLLKQNKFSSSSFEFNSAYSEAARRSRNAEKKKDGVCFAPALTRIKPGGRLKALSLLLEGKTRRISLNLKLLTLINKSNKFNFPLVYQGEEWRFLLKFEKISL